MSSKSKTATCGEAARAIDGTITITATRTQAIRMIVTRESGVATNYRLQGKTIQSCFKLELPLSSVPSKSGHRED